MKKIPGTPEQAKKYLQNYKSLSKEQLLILYGIKDRTSRIWRVRSEEILNNQSSPLSYYTTKNISVSIPDGQKLKGLSTYYDAEGAPRAQWIKTTADQEAQRMAMLAAVDALKSELAPLPPVAHKNLCNDDLLALYTIADYHLGMFAHKEEGGEDWDLDIAEDKLKSLIDASIAMAPDAHTGLLLQLGDFLHQDSIVPVTPASGHALDTGARYQKMISVAVKGLRYAISRMLEKHKHVHVIMADANHDPTGSVWLRELFGCLYENESRVTIDRTEHPYYCYEWGNTSIFAHHGDKRNMNNVSQVFAGLYREVFGRTKYSYGHLGHFHHSAAKEDSLMHVQIHPTFAAKDAYAARYGYLSQRKVRTIIYSKKYGEVGSLAITPEMV